MLLPDNVHPTQSLYFNGSFVLQELQNKSKQNLLDLYQTVKIRRNMTFPVFILCLDWLFLLNAAVLNNHNEIEICS